MTRKQVNISDDFVQNYFNVQSVSCYQRDCEMCRGTENVIRNAEQRFEDKYLSP
jgi:hypothetical protein